ncbi:Ribosome biogenesis protein [Gonapodya sp. JEL0774]|nr:Ribosome biogenesis protein [Gonapodya sp. JEL0774]
MARFWLFSFLDPSFARHLVENPQPQNEYIEEAVKKHGRRLDHEERKRKRAAREVHKKAAFAQKVHGLKAKLYNKKRHNEKIQMKKTLKVHDERTNKHATPDANPATALPPYLLDRQTETRAKVLSNAIKQKRKERAAKWDVPLPKVRAVAEEEVFKVIKTGKKGTKQWKRLVSKHTFVPQSFTRLPPKYERFIRPTALRVKRAHVTHPELKATFMLDVLGVKKNPNGKDMTGLGVITKGTIIEVNVSELGLVTQSGKVVWGKYAQVTNNPENDGVVNAVGDPRCITSNAWFARKLMSPFRAMDRAADIVLLEATEAQDIDKLQEALSNGADPNVRKKITLLCDLRKGQRSLGKIRVRKRFLLPDVYEEQFEDIVDTQMETLVGESALALAILAGWSTGIRALLCAGADANQPISWHNSDCAEVWTLQQWVSSRWIRQYTLESPLLLAMGKGGKVTNVRDGQPSAFTHLADTGRLRINKAGARVLLRNPARWEDACVEVAVKPRKDIVDLLVNFGARITAEVLHTANRLHDLTIAKFLETKMIGSPRYAQLDMRLRTSTELDSSTSLAPGPISESSPASTGGFRTAERSATYHSGLLLGSSSTVSRTGARRGVSVNGPRSPIAVGVPVESSLDSTLLEISRRHGSLTSVAHEQSPLDKAEAARGLSPHPGQSIEQYLEQRREAVTDEDTDTALVSPRESSSRGDGHFTQRSESRSSSTTISQRLQYRALNDLLVVRVQALDQQKSELQDRYKLLLDRVKEMERENTVLRAQLGAVSAQGLRNMSRGFEAGKAKMIRKCMHVVKNFEPVEKDEVALLVGQEVFWYFDVGDGWGFVSVTR